MKRNRNRIKGKVFVISGPSGSGKTTLRDRLLEDRALRPDFVKSVSFTTRPKRSLESDKKDYLFISEREFKNRLKAKKILEWTKYLGYYYATSRDFLDKHLGRNKNIVLCLDLKGALKIKRIYPKDSVSIFILPPSIRELAKRIEGRCNRTRKEEIRERLKLARRELSEAHKYDYRVVNKSLRQAIRGLKEILLQETGARKKRGKKNGVCCVGEDGG